ncbi:hypothetical protein NW761_008285 [Fusarium oxysporum]|nr:hypothetical protein NW758_006714 [Fusarium oxysporum]KAJ4086665.1 hypothetical protein NW761_008285 [Fusarium oxysporum]
MDPNLELYKSVLHLGVADRRQRLQHLPRSELSRLHIIVTREKQAQRLEELIAGRDLVQLALTDPSEVIECTPLKYALLGRTTYSYDEDEMVSRITNNIARSSQILVDTIARFDQVTKPFRLDALKLVYCDIYYVDGGNATLQEILEARLQEEELQTPAEQARELVRYNALKRARRNAKWMIPAMERLSEEEQAQPTHKYMETLQRIWKQVSPAPPPWIQKILDTRQQWGFIYYLSREANQKYGSDWESVWARIKDSMAPPAERNMGDATWRSIHCQGEDNRRKVLEPLLTEDWPKFYPNDSLAEDEDFRR